MNLTQRSVSAGSPIYARTMNGVLNEVRRLGSLASFKGKGGMIMRSRKAGVGGASSYRAPFEVNAVYATKENDETNKMYSGFIVNGGIWFGNTRYPYYGRRVVLPCSCGDAFSDTFVIPESIGLISETDLETYGEDKSEGENLIYEIVITVYLEPKWEVLNNVGFFTKINLKFFYGTLDEIQGSIRSMNKSVFAIVGQFRMRFNVTLKTADIVEDDTVRILRSDYFHNNRQTCLYTNSSAPLHWYRVDNSAWMLTGGYVRVRPHIFDKDHGNVLSAFGYRLDVPGCWEFDVDLKIGEGVATCLALTSEFDDYPTTAQDFNGFCPIAKWVQTKYFNFSDLPYNTPCVIYMNIKVQPGYFSTFITESYLYSSTPECSYQFIPQTISLVYDAQKRWAAFCGSEATNTPFIAQSLKLRAGFGVAVDGTEGGITPPRFGEIQDAIPIAVAIRREVSEPSSSKTIVDVFPIEESLIQLTPTLNLRMMYGCKNYGPSEIQYKPYSCFLCSKCLRCVNTCYPHTGTCYCAITEGRDTCNYSEWLSCAVSTATLFTGELAEMQDASNVE